MNTNNQSWRKQQRFYVIAVTLIVALLTSGTVAYACGWGNSDRPRRQASTWTPPPERAWTPPVPQWTPSWQQPTWEPPKSTWKPTWQQPTYKPKPPSTWKPTWKQTPRPSTSKPPTTRPPTTARPPTSTPTPTPTTPKPTTTPTTPTPTPTTTPTGLTAVEAEVFRLTNVERVKAGCQPLTVDSRFVSLARNHSKNMAAQNNMSHTLDGLSPSQRAQAAGVNNYSGENIAYGYKTPQAVMTGWMNSSGHRANILNCNSKVIGVGTANSNAGVIYWTQVFGR